MTIDDLITQLQKSDAAKSSGEIMCARGVITGIHVEFFKNDEITHTDKANAEVISLEFTTNDPL